jgi:DnaJ family protein C protein 19
MTRVLILAGLVLLAYRMLLNRWPWEPRPAKPRSPEEARARALLGVSESARRKEIVDAHRRLITKVHPDRGGTGELVHEANAARDLLLAQIAATTMERK